MNAQGKLNFFWLAAAIGIAWMIANASSSGLIFLLVVVAVIVWAVRNGNIR